MASVLARNTSPEDVILQDITRGQWSDLCQFTAEGVKLNDALGKLDIRPSVFRNVMREDAPARAQLIGARSDWDNRNWPEELVNTICLRYSTGEKLKDIAKDEIFEVSTFRALRLRDSYVNEQFERARDMRAEGWVDEIIELSDDDTNDMATDAHGGDKPNTAAVQRSRLRADNRKWLASKILHKQYGDNQKIEHKVDMVIDHAERLEAARARKAKAAGVSVANAIEGATNG